MMKSIVVIGILNELVEYFATTIEIKQLAITQDYYADEAIIAADKNMISTSFRNIISNAVKYTPEGGSITIRVTKPAKSHVIEIIDTGLGMDEDSTSKLFTYDKTHRKSGIQGESSSGIGLMLTKEFLDMNNAAVRIKTETGKGSNFTVVI